MKIPENNFDDVDEMLRHVEVWVKEGQASKSKLAGIQKRIDIIDDKYRYDADAENRYPRLFELQAIVYQLEGHKKIAREFAQKAIENLPKDQKPASKLTEMIAKNDTSHEEKLKWNEGDGYIIDSPIQEENILFFHRSPNVVFWLSLLSLNLYNVYWVYRHYRTINKSSGQKFYAFWRAIFQIFFIHTIIKLITNASEQHKNSPWHGNVGWTSAGYIIALFMGNAAAKATTKSQEQEIIYWVFAILLTVLVALITRSVQKAANYHNNKVLGTNYNFRATYLGRVYAGEIILTTIGAILFALGLLGSAASFVANTYPQGTEYEISAAKDKMDQLTKQYDTCSNALSTRHDSVDTTDQAAIDSYNSDWRACEDVRLSQNEAVHEYNRLAGLKEE